MCFDLRKVFLEISSAILLKLNAETGQHVDLSILYRSEAYHSASYKSCEENQVTDSELEQLNGFLTAAAVSSFFL